MVLYTQLQMDGYRILVVRCFHRYIVEYYLLPVVLHSATNGIAVKDCKVDSIIPQNHPNHPTVK